MPEEKKKCPACAEENPAGATVCKFCGEKLSNASSSQEMPGAAQKLELYNPKAAGIWSLLFTPIFGAYVLKTNWKILGREQQEKRSKIWLIALIIIGIIGLVFLSAGFCTAIDLISLVSWFFLECKPQMKYLADNKIDFQKKNWKSLVPKAAGILIGIWLIFFIIGYIFGGPTLDYSSPEEYVKSCKEIIEYLAEDLGSKNFEEILEKNAEHSDELTEEEKKVLAVGSFLGYFQGEIRGYNIHDKNLKETIDGMSAYELLEYVDENYQMDSLGYLHEKE